MSEDWASVRGYEGLYDVSNLGAVRGIIRTPRGKSVTIDPEGYRRVYLSKEGKKRWFKISRLIALHFLSPSENPLQIEVNHINGVKLDDRSDNLEWVTRKENAHHAMRNGLLAFGSRNGKHTKPEKTLRGSRHGKSKLSEDQVKQIKARIKHGESDYKIATAFHVSAGTIWFIRHGRIWAHVAL